MIPAYSRQEDLAFEASKILSQICICICVCVYVYMYVYIHTNAVASQLSSKLRSLSYLGMSPSRHFGGWLWPVS